MRGERDFFEQRPGQVSNVDARFRNMGARGHYVYRTENGAGVTERLDRIPDGGEIVMHLSHRKWMFSGDTFMATDGQTYEHDHHGNGVTIKVQLKGGSTFPYPVHVPGRLVPKENE